MTTVFDDGGDARRDDDLADDDAAVVATAAAADLDPNEQYFNIIGANVLSFFVFGNRS